MVEQYHRFTPTTYAARKFLDSGALGKILGVRIHISHQGPQEWSPRGRWFFEKRHAMGGPLADLGIHAIDLLRCITGKEVSRVACLTWKVRKRIDVEDNAAFVMKFSDGTGGTLEANWCQRPGEFSYLLYGEKGTMEFRENRLSAYLSPPDPAKVVPVRIPKETPTGNAFDHFVRCVRLGERPLVDGREGAKSLEVILAAYESAETGREVKLPLGK
jgi:predicted dehydrogenase